MCCFVSALGSPVLTITVIHLPNIASKDSPDTAVEAVYMSKYQ